MANEEAIKHLNRIIGDMQKQGMLPEPPGQVTADLLVAPWLRQGAFFRVDSQYTSNGRPLIVINPNDWEHSADQLRQALGPLGLLITLENLMAMLAEHLEERYQRVIKEGE